MKLSEAIMLGSTTCKMIPGDWNSCALGCAANAIGIQQASIDLVQPGIKFFNMPDGRQRHLYIFDAWPWLEETGCGIIIWNMFDLDVCSGKKTLEQLVDYVRSIEPACGECNSYRCACNATSAEEINNIVCSIS